jgi:hypothetical protein
LQNSGTLIILDGNDVNYGFPAARRAGNVKIRSGPQGIFCLPSANEKSFYG